MASDSQALQQARKLIDQLDFDGPIDLLSPIDGPSPDQLFALAESYFLKATSANHFSDLQRTHEDFPDLLARTALLALTQGDDWEAYLEWAKDENGSAPWVIVADRIVGMDKKKERVQKAKQLLSGEAGFGDSFDAWLGGDTVEMGEGETEQEDEPEKKRVRKAKQYSPDRIEAMGPRMRERLIVGLLAKGLGTVAE